MYNMLKSCATTARVWSKFTARNKNGKLLKFRIEDLPSDRIEDFLDFKMKYFVSNELQHQISGITDSEDAMNEYRNQMSEIIRHPSYHAVICCPDDDNKTNPEIIAMSMMSLKTRDIWQDELLNVECKTKEMEIYLKSIEVLDNIYPLTELMKNYGIDRVFDDRGVAVNNDYNGLGICNAMAPVRRAICKEYGVPMTVCWITSIGVRKAIERDGWETLLEISCKDMEKRLGLPINKGPATFVYAVARV